MTALVVGALALQFVTNDEIDIVGDCNHSQRKGDFCAFFLASTACQSENEGARTRLKRTHIKTEQVLLLVCPTPYSVIK